jgi:hypothetical protein
VSQIVTGTKFIPLRQGAAAKRAHVDIGRAVIANHSEVLAVKRGVAGNVGAANDRERPSPVKLIAVLTWLLTAGPSEPVAMGVDRQA